MSKSRPLTPKQIALVERLRGGRLLIASRTPGRDDEPNKWYIESPYSDEDGRTVEGLLTRELLKSEGGAMYILDEAKTNVQA